MRTLSDYLLFLEGPPDTQNLKLRPDVNVEFSGILAMVQVENSTEVEFITFVRLDSECSNPFGIENADQILSIVRLGANGLNMNSPSSYPNPKEFNSQLLEFKLRAESIAEAKVKDVSWHRLDKRDLREQIFVNRLQNFYLDLFFINSVYMNDSTNSWSEEKPKRVIGGLPNNDLVHLPIDPKWWLYENHLQSFKLALSIELKKAESEINREISFFEGQFRIQNLGLDFVERN